jgi:hypothetical protein
MSAKCQKRTSSNSEPKRPVEVVENHISVDGWEKNGENGTYLILDAARASVIKLDAPA